MTPPHVLRRGRGQERWRWHKRPPTQNLTHRVSLTILSWVDPRLILDRGQRRRQVRGEGEPAEEALSPLLRGKKPPLGALNFWSLIRACAVLVAPCWRPLA